MSAKGQLVIRKSVLKKIMQLPEEVDISHVRFDVERDNTVLILTSEEPVQELTFPSYEGCSHMFSTHNPISGD